MGHQVLSGVWDESQPDDKLSCSFWNNEEGPLSLIAHRAQPARRSETLTWAPRRSSRSSTATAGCTSRDGMFSMGPPGWISWNVSRWFAFLHTCVCLCVQICVCWNISMCVPCAVFHLCVCIYLLLVDYGCRFVKTRPVWHVCLHDLLVRSPASWSWNTRPSSV